MSSTAIAVTDPIAAFVDVLAEAIAAKVISKMGGVPANEQDSPIPLKHCGQSVRVLRDAIAAGDLHAVKVGRGYQVRPSELAAWLDAQAVAPRQRPVPALSPAERAIAAAQRRGALRVV